MAHWIRLSLLCRCKWTRKSQVSYENVSEQYLWLFYEHTSVYCGYRRNLWISIFVYGVLSLFMEFYLCPWSSILVYGVLSLSMEFYLCLRSSIFVCGCCVNVYGAVWVQSICLLGASLIRLIACLTVGSYILHAYPTSWAQGPRAQTRLLILLVTEGLCQQYNELFNSQFNRQFNRP